MTSLAQTFAEAARTARGSGEHREEGCGWLSPELRADLLAFERELADRRARIDAVGRELADIRARLGAGA